MSVKQTGVTAHDNACNTAEMIRQVAVAAAGANQSSARNAELIYYRTLLTSARQNNNYADVAAATTALRELGVTT